ncbi:retrotransposon protein, putative, ty1-copia subclass [Tanacetum coccineum]|uniref:Retrotransposon protein, putative, ty1-copia subclass n=1 Tax=Tanacetum coccineum TaxID=301880 RepID=A0ABQ5CA75_9ASTR
MDKFIVPDFHFSKPSLKTRSLQLRLVLSTEDKEKYLEQPIPSAHVAAAPDQPIPPANLPTYKEQDEGQSVSSYVLKMKSYIDQLERLGHPVTLNLGVSLILVGLSKEYDNFVHNYNIHNMGKTVNELHVMLKLHEETLPKKVVAPALHAIRARKDNPAKDAICHHCGEVGHWRRNCPTYLTELLKKKQLSQGASTSGPAGNAIPRDGVYEIEMSCSNTNDSSMYAVSNKRAKLNLDSSLLWHCRLGHISKKRIEKLQHDGLLNSTDIESLGKCVSCMSGKMARKPYSHQVERAKDLPWGQLIQTMMCGPFNNRLSRQGANYFVTFTDDFSRYGYVYLLKHKHEVFETFKVFQKEVENQLGKTIKSLRSDRGGEYMSQEFLDHLKEHEIIAHRTPPYTPQHNGVSERRNRTLLDMVRSMMSQTTLPKSFWDYALESVARILNMVPTKKVDKKPYEIWHKQAPKLSYLKVWGCEALVMRDTLTKPDKQEPRSFKCIFIGYPKETIRYFFYNPSENKVFVARNVEFFESNLIDQEAKDDQEIDEPQSDINPIRRSTRTKRAPDRMCLYIDAEEHELGDLGKPANYKDALLDPESEKWLAAMNVEMQSMKDNDIWELVELPPNAKIVGHKWLFKKKIDMDGVVHTFKSCLVAKGFTQTYRIDYEETFSLVADIRAIRILIAIVTFYVHEIWQMDVKTAFLNGHLFEEVYMTQWNKRFDDEIKKFGFTQNRDEPCVYQKASGSYVTFLILYVDYILIMGNNILMLQDVKSYLERYFAMKDLGEAAYIIGIKIYQDRSKRLIGLCQSAYIEKILKRYYMENSKRGTIPMQEKLKLSKSDGASTPAEKRRMSNVPYALAVGSIMYAVRCTRLDVAFTQNITSRFQQNPGELHWTTIKNILKYLQNNKDMFLVYRDADDLKSQTGYVFVLNGGAVDWKSTKQTIFATSSTDAEYIAAFDASKEAVWIRKFIYGLNVVLTIEEPITMYCDNTRAIAIAKDHGVTKEASGSLEDLEIIQEEDTNPYLDTSLIFMMRDDQEIDEPQSDINPIRRSTRTKRAPDRMCLFIDAEEHELGDLDIRAIRILIAIAAFYDYEIWQMDVKITFLNGHLFEEVYMTQPEGFVNPKYPNHNILKYLRNTKDMFLVYGGDMKRELRVSCYTDAGYLTDADDLKSQTGYVFVLMGCVDWRRQRQTIFCQHHLRC